MEIKNDLSYISATGFELIDRGYAMKTVYSIHFDRHYSAEERRKNGDLHASMTREEWAKHCDEVAESFVAPMNEILQLFIGKYDIHQVTPETSTMNHYRSDWDLFFNSRKIRGYDLVSRFDSFTLTFNSKRTPEQNNALLEEILRFVETLEYKNIACRVQYQAFRYDDKIAEAALKAFEKLDRKTVDMYGSPGKIRIVRVKNGKNQYGFFRKHARKKFVPLENHEVLAMTFI